MAEVIIPNSVADRFGQELKKMNAGSSLLRPPIHLNARSGLLMPSRWPKEQKPFGGYNEAWRCHIAQYVVMAMVLGAKAVEGASMFGNPKHVIKHTDAAGVTSEISEPKGTEPKAWLSAAGWLHRDQNERLLMLWRVAKIMETVRGMEGLADVLEEPATEDDIDRAIRERDSTKDVSVAIDDNSLKARLVRWSNRKREKNGR